MVHLATVSCWYLRRPQGNLGDSAKQIHNTEVPPERIGCSSECSEVSHVSNPVSELLVVEERNEQRNAHWFSFQRSEPSTKADAAPLGSALGPALRMKDLKGDNQLPEASPMRSKISNANKSSSKSKNVDEQRNAQWFTGMLEGHANREVSTCTLDVTSQIFCRNQLDRATCCYLLSLSCLVSGSWQKDDEEEVLAPS